MGSQKKSVSMQRLEQSLKNYTIDAHTVRKILKEVKGEESLQAKIIAYLDSRADKIPSSDEERNELLRQIASIIMDNLVFE